MKYQYLRLFLNQIEQCGDLFDAPIPRLPRAEFLIEEFTRRIDFEHRQKPFVFVPIGQHEVDGGLICLGRVGREVAEFVNRPPEEDFADYETVSWRAANILLDTRSDPDGQKAAFQCRNNVGKGLPIVSSLVEYINQRALSTGWNIEVNPMTRKEGFWDIAREYKGSITSVDFEFVTPNILQLRNKLNDELKGARANENATKVGVSYKNKDGNLNLDTEEISDAVDYNAEGGGRTKIKVGKKSVYDSQKEEKLQDVEDDEPLNIQKKSTWKRISDTLFL